MATPVNLNVFHDKQFGAALLAAPLFWTCVWWWNPVDFNPGWPLDKPLLFLSLSLVYPVLEELVFRGGLQTWLLQWPFFQKSHYSISIANILTSLLFSAAHLFSHIFAWAAATMIPSLVFGYFYDRDKSLVRPMILHAYYNTGYFWLFSN